MTTKGELLEAIRKTCLRCTCGSWKAVEDCQTEKSKSMWKEYEICPLFPFRFGSDPTPAKGGRNPFLKKESSYVAPLESD